MEKDKSFLGTKPVGKLLLQLALPTVAAQLINMLYNIVDRIYIGHIPGEGALALTGVGVCMPLIMVVSAFAALVGNGGAPRASIFMGKNDTSKAEQTLGNCFTMQIIISLILTVILFLGNRSFLLAFGASANTIDYAVGYMNIYAVGTIFVQLTLGMNNFITAQGFAKTGMLSVLIGAVTNIILDPIFIFALNMGIQGAALATVIAQFASGLGITLYTLLLRKDLRPHLADLRWNVSILREIGSLSLLTCMQQSVMNFGILMVQGLVNRFGPVIMAAFAAAVKIDSFAYMPVQDFGNAFSTFVAQNYGARQYGRIREGIQKAVRLTLVFCLAVSVLVLFWARPLMLIFVQPQETATIAAGVTYLRIEGTCYWGIGCLFLLYGLYRAIKRPAMSLILTVISLGTRVALAYALAGPVGVRGIWISIPIGWLLADGAGLLYYRRHRNTLLSDL